MVAYNGLMSTKGLKLKYGTSTQLGIKPTRDCVILKVQNIYNGNCIENFTFYSLLCRSIIATRRDCDGQCSRASRT